MVNKDLHIFVSDLFFTAVLWCQQCWG